MNQFPLYIGGQWTPGASVADNVNQSLSLIHI